MDRLKDAEELNFRLKDDLEDKAKQLMNNSNELAHSHSELKKSRNEINVS